VRYSLMFILCGACLGIALALYAVRRLPEDFSSSHRTL
jgi:hypothetical protein